MHRASPVCELLHRTSSPASRIVHPHTIPLCLVQLPLLMRACRGCLGVVLGLDIALKLCAQQVEHAGRLGGVLSSAAPKGVQAIILMWGLLEVVAIAARASPLATAPKPSVEQQALISPRSSLLLLLTALSPA